MSALDILYRAIDKSAETEGWNNTMLLCIACEYIDNQQSPEAFEDFVAQQLAEPYPHRPPHNWVSWTCPCGSHNVDSPNLTSKPLCPGCGAEYEWYNLP